MATYTLRIYDATGCVLAEGPLIADPTLGMDATHRYRVQIATTGTAKRCSVTAPGFEVSGDFEALGFDTRALCSGNYLAGMVDLTTAGQIDAHDARERGEKAERRQREAALVALVNAVPAWADPTAWRVAVLTAEEAYRVGRALPWLADAGVAPAFIDCMTMLHEGHDGPPGSTATVAMAAYRRALTPHKAPAPEKRRGGKAVRLTVDDGRDDD